MYGPLKSLMQFGLVKIMRGFGTLKQRFDIWFVALQFFIMCSRLFCYCIFVLYRSEALPHQESFFSWERIGFVVCSVDSLQRRWPSLSSFASSYDEFTSLCASLVAGLRLSPSAFPCFRLSLWVTS